MMNSTFPINQFADTSIEEEQGNQNHPQLWKDFALGLGVSASELENGPTLEKNQKLSKLI